MRPLLKGLSCYADLLCCLADIPAISSKRRQSSRLLGIRVLLLRCHTSAQKQKNPRYVRLCHGLAMLKA